MTFAKTLTRDEMKNVMAGDDFCGDIHCNVGGSYLWSGSGCGDKVMLRAMENCELEAVLRDSTCNGCVQFQ